MKKSVLLSILFLVLLQSSSNGQWKIIAKNVFNVTNGFGGAVIYRDGNLWAGMDSLWLSKDSGFNWVHLPLKLKDKYDWIDVINFYNKNIGVVGTEHGDVFLTHDQGNSWTKLFNITGCLSAIFFNDSNHILIGQTSPPNVYLTIDGGKNWVSSLVDSLGHPPADSASELQHLLSLSSPGSALAISGGVGRGSHIYKTTDYGITWIKMPGEVAFDCITFSIDSCAPNRIYVVNENDGRRLDDSSRVYISSDAGVSWSAINTRPTPFFCGSIATTQHAVYCPTIGSVYRSTDLGLHWKSIGGPPMNTDTRTFAAINDNILIGSDAYGNVYRTDNSGGDSVISIIHPIECSSRDQKTDSIGGLVYVPIIITNPNQYSFLESTIQYSDTSRLRYLGTYTRTGKNIDIANEHWKQRSKIMLSDGDLSVSSDTVAFSVFRVYPKSEQPCADIIFDSIIYIGPDNSCNFLTAVSISAHLCSCLNCPNASVPATNLPLDQPNIFIYPNPSTRYLTISSSQDLGIVEIEIIDILGNIQAHLHKTLGPGNDDQLDLQSLPNGHYVLRVSGFGFIESFSIVHY